MYIISKYSGIHFILIDQSYEIYSENLSHFVMSWPVEGNLLRTV